MLDTPSAPRWANILFGISAPLIVCAFVGWGLLLGYDFRATLGFLMMNIFPMFFTWLFLGLLLNGVVWIMRFAQGHRPSRAQALRILGWVASLGFTVLFFIAMNFRVFELRWWITMSFATTWLVFFVFLTARIRASMMRGMDEKARLRMQDELCKWDDDEDHKWFGI